MCRYFHTQENNTIMERAKLVCTQADMTECRKWILLIFVHEREREREPIKSGNYTNLQIKQFLLRYSKMYPWAV